MTSDATERVRQDWDSQAAAWFRQRESFFAASRPIHEWMVDHLAPRPGARVLEIAAGPGDTGFLAAKRLADGRLLSTDLSPSMVESARKRGEELGVKNADYRVLDAQAMDLPDESFDGVLCRWGFMLMPDPLASLRECRRVLIPDGRLVFAVFTGQEENPFASLPARILMDWGFLPKPTGGWQPGILALADRTRLLTLIDRADFTSVHVEAVGMTWTFADADDYWAFLVELTALGPLVRTLPVETREKFRSAIDEQLTRFTTAGGVALPSRCWCGVATR
ncbi:MAG TPA: methyltransferase domain-containing protein [Gemmatimonadaceae bacterium]|jgi:ubiquinone/menaquinone biosynthesis C-methylase UbiE|nr:methyltransferase domain-containing protein [Gemmatimonadaceae bacterium]